MKALIFDLDQTLIDSRAARQLRDARQWAGVYRMVPRLHPYPGIDELLTWLQQRGFRLALVTSSPSTYCLRVLSQWRWHFDAIIAYHDTWKHKPHPEPLLLALRRLGVSAENVLTVGDDARDVQAAHAAGLPIAAALWGADYPPALLACQPEYVCTTVTDLTQAVSEWAGGS